MCLFGIVVCASANPPAAITHNRTCAFPPANRQSKERVENSHFSFFSSATSGERILFSFYASFHVDPCQLKSGIAGKNRGKNTHILIHAIVARSQRLGRPNLDGPEDTCIHYGEYIVLNDAKICGLYREKNVWKYAKEIERTIVQNFVFFKYNFWLIFRHPIMLSK